MNINNLVSEIHFLLEQIKRDVNNDEKLLKESNYSLEEIIDSIENTLENNLQSCRELKEELKKFI